MTALKFCTKKTCRHLTVITYTKIKLETFCLTYILISCELSINYCYQGHSFVTNKQTTILIGSQKHLLSTEPKKNHIDIRTQKQGEIVITGQISSRIVT